MITNPLVSLFQCLLRSTICDGHDSHIMGEWVAHCINNKLIPMILPPHSSHLTQPLDVGVFGPLKQHIAAEIDPIIRTGVSRIQKVEWLTAFVKAHKKAMRPKIFTADFVVPEFICMNHQKSLIDSPTHYQIRKVHLQLDQFLKHHLRIMS